MKIRLLKLAKEEGLLEAYMIKDLSGEPEIYRIDAQTGEIRMVKECKVLPLNIRSLRRFVVASADMRLENKSAFSVLAPESLILNEVEIEKNERTSKPKPIIVSNPLLDKNVVSIKAKKKKRN